MCIYVVKAFDGITPAEIALVANPMQLKKEWRRILVQLPALISLQVSLHSDTGDLWIDWSGPVAASTANTYLDVNGYVSLQAVKWIYCKTVLQIFGKGTMKRIILIILSALANPCQAKIDVTSNIVSSKGRRKANAINGPSWIYRLYCVKDRKGDLQMR